MQKLTINTSISFPSITSIRLSNTYANKRLILSNIEPVNRSSGQAYRLDVFKTRSIFYSELYVALRRLAKLAFCSPITIQLKGPIMWRQDFGLAHRVRCQPTFKVKAQPQSIPPGHEIRIRTRDRVLLTIYAIEQPLLLVFNLRPAPTFSMPAYPDGKGPYLNTLHEGEAQPFFPVP